MRVVALPEPGAYVVDVFRVTGGSTHDYCLHGSADADQSLACSVSLRPDPKALLPPGPEHRPWLDASQQGWRPVVNGVNILYGILDNVQSGPGTETATFTLTEAGGPSLSTTLIGQPGATLYCATMPAIRRAREVNADVLKHHTQMVLARRRGANLQSVFVAVHEPWQGARRLTRVARLPLENTGAGAAGILCESDGFTDYHLFGLQPDSDLRAAGLPLSATARYAFVRTAAGQPRTMAVVDARKCASATGSWMRRRRRGACSRFTARTRATPRTLCWWTPPWRPGRASLTNGRSSLLATGPPTGWPYRRSGTKGLGR